MSKQRFGGLKHGPCPDGPRPKKMADGGPVRSYGAPIDGTPKPGTSTRRRPKPGDKSGDTRLLNPKRRGYSPEPPKKGGNEVSTYRDYRGVDGAVDDAVKGK